MESGWSCGSRHKLVLFCTPNQACASPFPFQTCPSILSKTRVQTFPWSKQNWKELKNELTWWFNWCAQERVISPAIRGSWVGMDVSTILMSSPPALCIELVMSQDWFYSIVSFSNKILVIQQLEGWSLESILRLVTSSTCLRGIYVVYPWPGCGV